MPEDLWSYKGVILRGIIALPLTLLGAGMGVFSTKAQDALMHHVGNFIWWHY